MDLLDNKKFEIHRNDMSFTALTVFDMLIDIARITDDYIFKIEDIVFISSNVIDYIYRQGDEDISEDYLVNYTSAETGMFSKFFEDILVDDEDYRYFLEMYSLAIISELMLVEAFKDSDGSLSSNPTETVIIRRSLAELKISNASGTIHRFGDNCIRLGKYFDEVIEVTDLSNEIGTIKVSYSELQFTCEVNIEVICYIALMERVSDNKDVALLHIMDYMFSILESKGEFV